MTCLSFVVRRAPPDWYATPRLGNAASSDWKGGAFFSLCGWLLGSYKRPRSARYFPGTWLERANDRMRQFSLETIWAIMFMGS